MPHNEKFLAAICGGIVFFSGCASTSMQSAEPTAEPSSVALNSRDPHWSDCKALFTSVVLPDSLAPTISPPTWNEPPLGGLGAELKTEVYECERVKWGKFERGPVRMMWELHTGILPPEKCDSNRTFPIAFVMQVLVNDAELVEYMAMELGLPARFANISLRESLDPPHYSQAWNWNVPEFPESTLESFVVGGEIDETKEIGRIVWVSTTSLFFMDWSSTLRNTYTNKWLVHGVLAAPMYYASLGIPTFISDGASTGNYAMTGHMWEFSDFQCEHPR
ncbi:MAG: hypothetical protein AABX89_04440 [Candidatus Thermoplasmatota archaeon]